MARHSKERLFEVLADTGLNPRKSPHQEELDEHRMRAERLAEDVKYLQDSRVVEVLTEAVSLMKIAGHKDAKYEGIDLPRYPNPASWVKASASLSWYLRRLDDKYWLIDKATFKVEREDDTGPIVGVGYYFPFYSETPVPHPTSGLGNSKHWSVGRLITNPDTHNLNDALAEMVEQPTSYILRPGIRSFRGLIPSFVNRTGLFVYTPEKFRD